MAGSKECFIAHLTDINGSHPRSRTPFLQGCCCCNAFGDTLFVHSSLDRIKQSAKDAIDLISVWQSMLGETGSIFMPSYSWKGSPGRPLEGSVFDVRKTPSQVGLLSEIFRRMNGTYRSESYWVPVCGRGAIASKVLSNQLTTQNPFSVNLRWPRMSRPVS